MNFLISISSSPIKGFSFPRQGIGSVIANGRTKGESSPQSGGDGCDDDGGAARGEEGAVAVKSQERPFRLRATGVRAIRRPWPGDAQTGPLPRLVCRFRLGLAAERRPGFCHQRPLLDLVGAATPRVQRDVGTGGDARAAGVMPGSPPRCRRSALTYRGARRGSVHPHGHQYTGYRSARS